MKQLCGQMTRRALKQLFSCLVYTVCVHILYLCISGITFVKCTSFVKTCQVSLKLFRRGCIKTKLFLANFVFIFMHMCSQFFFSSVTVLQYVFFSWLLQFLQAHIPIETAISCHRFFLFCHWRCKCFHCLFFIYL